MPASRLVNWNLVKTNGRPSDRSGSGVVITWKCRCGALDPDAVVDELAGSDDPPPGPAGSDDRADTALQGPLPPPDPAPDDDPADTALQGPLPPPDPAPGTDHDR